MQEKITPYIRKHSNNNPALQLQFLRVPQENDFFGSNSADPLNEDSHEVTKGLVHKYTNRALIKTSLRCAAHCRFCTRYRQIGSPVGDLSSHDIDGITSYIASNPQIDDVILSGGDPLYTPKTTIEVLEKLRSIDSIKVFRVGTRLPVQNPQSFNTPLIEQTIELMDEIGREKPFYMLLNVQHPSELTSETRCN